MVIATLPAVPSAAISTSVSAAPSAVILSHPAASTIAASSLVISTSPIAAVKTTVISRSLPTNTSPLSPGTSPSKVVRQLNTLKRNLVTPKCERHSIHKQHRLALAHWYARSINRKVEDVQHLLDYYGLHIMALMETWHESYDACTIKRICSLGFTVIEEARHSSASKPSQDNDR